MSENELFIKIAATGSGFLIFGLVGGRLFFALARHFILKYFEGQDAKISAAFRQIDELRSEFNVYRSTEFRDYKRDVAVEICKVEDSVKELYERTDNHKSVRETIEFCNKMYKRVLDDEKN